MGERIDWRMTGRVFFLNKRPRRTLARSPRADPWESTLPWAAVIINQTAAVVGNHGRGSACARAVGASTRHRVGTSVTARTPNACDWSDAGRRRGGRPSDARTMPSKPSTPRPNERAVSVPLLRHNPRMNPKLRRRVVTQQRLFFRRRSARGRVVTNRPPSRVATRPSIAVPPVERPFNGCSIVSANG